MKRNRTQYDPDKLEALAAQARHYAEHMMRTTGSVPATLIADTEDGYIFCMPSALTDETARTISPRSPACSPSPTTPARW